MFLTNVTQTRKDFLSSILHILSSRATQLSGGVLVPQNAICLASVPSGVANTFVADLFSRKGVNSSTLGHMGHSCISHKLEMFYGRQSSVNDADSRSQHPNIGTDPLRTWKRVGYENMSVSDPTTSPSPRRRRLCADSDID